MNTNMLTDLSIQTPSWDIIDNDPTATMLSALSRFLPSNMSNMANVDDFDVPVDAFACDDFRMYEFKVRKCVRARSHDWTECPFAHPGEKARRRDPRLFSYTGIPCPEFRKGTCRSGDACEYAHGVFECWLHPSRYRTQPCKDGTHCRRRVCFFAHTPDQLRFTESTHQPGFESLSTPSDSPPVSPFAVNELANQIAQMRMSMSVSPPGWGMGSLAKTQARTGFYSLPSTPTKAVARPGPGNGVFDIFEESFEEEPVMERVESGRDLRAKMYAKLSKDNSLNMSWI